MFSASYTAILILSYVLSTFSTFIIWSVRTKDTRHFTYLVTVGKVFNFLFLFVWNIVLQPEFLEEVICLRMHGIASNLCKYGVHLCVCVALILISATSLYYVTCAVCYLLTFRFPKIEKKLFSARYLTIVFFVYFFDCTLVFGLVYEAVNLEAFPTENNVACYVLSTEHLSTFIAITSSIHVIFKSTTATVMLTLLVRFLRKNETATNKEKIKTAIRTLIILSSVPLTMCALPFASIFIWSLFVSSSSALALFSNISSHVAMMHSSVLMVTTLLLLKPYRSAVFRLLRRKKVVQPVFIVNTNSGNR
uniref:G_PROTEIN_RECEP_F1_2 domain-containing protein n=1 Tax=Steinernema glaseri TaxID=37863 RepID=A0A1I7Y9C6_9BILA